MVSPLDPTTLRYAAFMAGEPAAGVKLAHLMNTTRPIVGPDERGRFPGSPLSAVPPVVLDANRLYQDLRAACKNGRRTVLVNAANSGMIRLFCAQHVVEEFYEHAEEWALKARIRPERFLARWATDYLPLLHMVDVPTGLLTPAEAERIAQLDHGPDEFRDPDDVPTATLALLLGAYLLSDDRKPLRAVYGHDADLSHHKQWLSVLQADGNAGVLQQMQRDGAQTAVFAGRATFLLLELLWTKVSPIAVLLLGGAAVYAYRRTSPSTRQRVANGVTKIVEYYAEIAAQQTRETDTFISVTAPLPTWSQMERAMPTTAAITRACLYTMARGARGDYSASELVPVLGFLHIPHSDAKVRAALRASRVFHQLQRGRFQVGRPVLDLHGGIDGNRAMRYHGSVVSLGRPLPGTPRSPGPA